MKSKTLGKPPPLTAKSADKFALYEASVQDTEADIAFLHRTFKARRGRVPMSLREDFCGTAKLCVDWVQSHRQRTAVGLDLHGPTLKVARSRHVSRLDGEATARVQLLQRNVLQGVGRPVDIAVAFNFSYCAFKERRELLRYFRRVRRDLCADGMFFLDVHGGTECFVELEETKKLRGFTYVWDQRPFDAVNGHGVRHIHFRFPDGSQLQRAFSYDWRLWHLPEMRDVLKEAGFAQIDTYWEGAGADGSGNGVFRRVKRADNEASFVAYLVGLP